MMPFINNNLYSEKFLQEEIKKIDEDIRGQFDEIKKLFGRWDWSKMNEDQLAGDFIKPVLQILGWSSLCEQDLVIQGKSFKPDFLLFEDEDSRQEFVRLLDCPGKAVGKMFVVCETKAFKDKLDTNKADKDNPHFQIVNYLLKQCFEKCMQICEGERAFLPYGGACRIKILPEQARLCTYEEGYTIYTKIHKIKKLPKQGESVQKHAGERNQ